MDIKQQLENALKDAIRSNNATQKNAIRMTLTNLKLSEVEKGERLDDNGIRALLQKEIKSRRESIQDAQKANRPDLIAESQAEIEVLSQFLPQQLSPEELEKLAREAVSETGAASPSDMGKVMKILLPRLQGRAPGDQVSQVVKKILSEI